MSSSQDTTRQPQDQPHFAKGQYVYSDWDDDYGFIESYFEGRYTVSLPNYTKDGDINQCHPTYSGTRDANGLCAAEGPMPAGHYEWYTSDDEPTAEPVTPPEQRVYPPASATHLMAWLMEQRIAALEAAIAALQARVSELEAERDEPSQGYATLAEAIAAENEKFIAEQAALGYDAELVASTVLSAPEREFICPVSCARCDKTVEYGELDERGLCHLCVMDLTEDDETLEAKQGPPGYLRTWLVKATVDGNDWKGSIRVPAKVLDRQVLEGLFAGYIGQDVRGSVNIDIRTYYDVNDPGYEPPDANAVSL